MTTRLLAAAAALVLLNAAPALAEYEVEEADVEKGEIEIEYQANHGFGTPQRKFTPDGDPDENSFTRQGHNIGASYGFTDWFKFGVFAEFESERFDAEDVESGDAGPNAFDKVRYGGLELEARAVVIPQSQTGWALTLYAEMELPREAEEADVLNFGPIIRYAQGPWSATTNLLFSREFNAGGEDDEIDEKWGFAANWQLKYDASERLSLALEGYHTFERIGDSGNPSEAKLFFGDQDTHLVGPVLYYTFKDHGTPKGSIKDDDDDKAGASGDDDDDDDGLSVTMGVGVLFGLNDETQDAVLKWSTEVEF